MCLRCLGMKHDWTDGTKKRWSRLFVYRNCGSFSPRSLNILFRNMYFMNLILKTKYTLSAQFVLPQVHINNHWRTSQVRQKILNDRTLRIETERQGGNQTRNAENQFQKNKKILTNLINIISSKSSTKIWANS